MGRARWLVSVVLPLLGLALVGAARTEQQAFSGMYVLDAAASDDVVQAFEPLLRDLNFITRRLARSRIGEAVKPDPFIRIDQAATEITIQAGEERVTTSPLDGTVMRHVTERGDTLSWSTRLQGEVLIQRLESPDGRYTNVFRLSPDRARLLLSVTLESGRLPEPIGFRLVYNRERRTQ